jgi:hypothetical protein
LEIKMKQIQIRCKGTSALSLDSFQNFQGNLKELREPEYKKLRRSIEKYGFRFPIFVWGNMILDGHQRILVLKKMISDGWSIDPLPVIEIEAENEKEAKHLLLLISSRYGHITDDGLYEFIMTSELNFDELKEEIDLPEIDFKQFEQSYFSEEPKDAEPQIDRAEELNKKWQVKMGDLWQIGEHRLLCGDSIKTEDVGRVMGGLKADCTVTDPPYGVGIDYEKFEDTLQNVRNLIAGFIPLVLEHLPAAIVSGVVAMWEYPRPEWVGTWVHPSAMGCGPWGFNGNNPILYYGKDPYLKAGKGSRPDSIVMATDRQGITGHPTPKPLKVWEWLIERMSVDQGQTVFEPFGGSGTGFVACQNLNRKCRGIEISPAYCAVILQRMEDAFGLTGVRI